MLQKYGFDTLTVCNAWQAIEAVQCSPHIDLVLMDIDLGHGEMDGTQAAEIILQQRDLPLIFLSGHTEREVVERTEGITSYGYIVKNSGETVLIASIKMAFRLFEARRLEQQKDAALRQSEERFRLAMEASQEGLWDSDLAAGTSYYSPAYWKILGYAPGEQLPYPKDWYSLVHPDDRAAVWQANQDCAENRVDSFLVEFRMRTRTGEWRWVQSRGKAFVRDAAGRAQRLLGTHIDITERKLAEAALAQSEQKFATAFQHAPVFMSISTIDEGRFISVNDAFVHVTGFTREEALGHTSGELGLLLPADRPQMIEALRTNGHVEEMAFTLYTKDKRPIQAAFNCEIILVGDKPHMLAIVQDMTARKQTEQALRQSEARFYQAFHAVPVALALSSLADGRYLEVNDEFTHLFGWSREQAIGRTAHELHLWADPGQRQVIMAQLQAHGAMRGFEMQVRAKSGQLKPILWSAELVPIGDELYVLAAALDITERKQMEQDRETALREKHDLLCELQHRTRNSFAAIDGLISFMAGANHNAATQAALAELGTWVKALTTLYDLLYTGETSAATPLDVYAARVAEALPRPPGLHLVQACDPILAPVRVATPLGLILTELLTNAIKHAFPAGRGGALSVTLRRAGERVTLQVADDGVGLPPGFDLARTSGLGLGLVQALAGQIGATFNIDNAAGTRCVVEFPLEAGEPIP